MKRPANSAPRAVLFPNHYVWYVLVSFLDLLTTHTVMRYFGAVEVNTIADRAIRLFGLWGLIGVKFGTVVLVVVICERIGRWRESTGRRLAEWAIAISAIPVVVALGQVALTRLR